MVMARTEAEADQRARVGHRLRLPAVISLIAAHGIFAGLIPGSRGASSQIVFADQGFLNGLSAFGINFLLAARGFPSALGLAMC